MDAASRQRCWFRLHYRGNHRGVSIGPLGGLLTAAGFALSLCGCRKSEPPPPPVVAEAPQAARRAPRQEEELYKAPPVPEPAKGAPAISDPPFNFETGEAGKAALSSVRGQVPKLIATFAKCSNASQGQGQGAAGPSPMPSSGATGTSAPPTDGSSKSSTHFITKVGILPSGDVRSVDLDADEATKRCVTTAVRELKFEAWDGGTVELELEYPPAPPKPPAPDGGAAASPSTPSAPPAPGAPAPPTLPGGPTVPGTPTVPGAPVVPGVPGTGR